jgi:hypothetical protein
MEETELFVDERCGFSVAVPGYPERIAVDPTAQPVRHAVLRLQAAPIEVGFRLDRIPTHIAAEALMPLIATAYAGGESDVAPEITIAGEELRRPWGAEGAASAIYPLKEPAPWGADVGEVTMLGRSAGPDELTMMVVSKRFDRQRVSPFVWASFNAAMMGSLSWQPGAAPPASAPALWPRSLWFKPGILMAPLDEQRILVGLLRALVLSATRETRAALRAWVPRLCVVSVRPTLPIGNGIREELRARFAPLEIDSPARGLLRLTVDSLQSVHDVRGLGQLLWEWTAPEPN